MKKEGGFTLPSFGKFAVYKTKARKALNPRTLEPLKVKAGKTVRFKASPNLKKAVWAASGNGQGRAPPDEALMLTLRRCCLPRFSPWEFIPP